MPDFVTVAKVDELLPGSKLLVDADGILVGLFNIAGEIYAIEDVCTHDGGPLVDGDLEDGEIVCPRHGARFCVRTGKALTMPAFEDVDTFEVRIQGDEIQIAV